MGICWLVNITLDKCIIISVCLTNIIFLQIRDLVQGFLFYLPQSNSLFFFQASNNKKLFCKIWFAFTARATIVYSLNKRRKEIDAVDKWDFCETRIKRRREKDKYAVLSNKSSNIVVFSSLPITSEHELYPAWNPVRQDVLLFAQRNCWLNIIYCGHFRSPAEFSTKYMTLK